MAVVWTVAEGAVGVATAAWAAVANGIDPREGGRIASQRGRCNQVRNQGRGHGGVIRISRKEGGGGEIHARGQSHVRGFRGQRKRFQGTIPHKDARGQRGQGNEEGKDHVRGSEVKVCGTKGGNRCRGGRER